MKLRGNLSVEDDGQVYRRKKGTIWDTRRRMREHYEEFYFPTSSPHYQVCMHVVFLFFILILLVMIKTFCTSDLFTGSFEQCASNVSVLDWITAATVGKSFVFSCYTVWFRLQCTSVTTYWLTDSDYALVFDKTELDWHILIMHIKWHWVISMCDKVFFR